MVSAKKFETCAICGRSVDLDAPHFRIRRPDAWQLEPGEVRFANQPSHWSCYEASPVRKRLARRVIDEVMYAFGNMEYRELWSDPRVILCLCADEPKAERAILLFLRTGSSTEVPFADWDPASLLEGRGPMESRDLKRALPSIRRLFPTGASLTAGVPWEEMKAKAEEIRRSVEHDLAILRASWAAKERRPKRRTPARLG